MGQLRFCCDFRYLNAVTIKDACPIPRIDQSLSKLGDAKFFTTLDLVSASWQVPLRKKDREKNGFALGLYQWKRMPFGLCNATATFQTLMAQALTRVTKKYGKLVMCYVDDVVIATPTLKDRSFELRVDNRALSWLKTYSMDQSYIGKWIVRLDSNNMIIEHTMRDKYQNPDSFSRKTEFHERLEQKQANQAEIKKGFSFLDKETYEALLLTRWLDKSGHPIPGHPELPVEKAAEIKILSKKDPVLLDLLLRSNLVQRELYRRNINSLSLLDKTVQVTPQKMRMLCGLSEREVTRDDPGWAAAVASMTVSEKVKIFPSRR